MNSTEDGRFSWGFTRDQNDMIVMPDLYANIYPAARECAEGRVLVWA